MYVVGGGVSYLFFTFCLEPQSRRTSTYSVASKPRVEVKADLKGQHYSAQNIT